MLISSYYLESLRKFSYYFFFQRNSFATEINLLDESMFYVPTGKYLPATYSSYQETKEESDQEK